MEATSITAPAAGDERAPRQELKKGAISYISNVVIGVASTAPGYSLAATVGFMVGVAGIGVHNPAVVGATEGVLHLSRDALVEVCGAA